MYSVEVKRFDEKGMVLMSEMKDGDIGRIVGGVYPNVVVMRKYDKVFSLSSGNSYWDRNAGHQVELFPVGTKIELTVQ